MRATAALLEDYLRPFALETVDLADPAPGQLVVRTTAAPFCSTDWMGWRAMRRKVPPVILGHTAIGEVVATGDAVTHVGPGDRVLVAATPRCGTCFYCAEGRPDQCTLLMEEPDPVVGATRDGREVRAAGRVGGYASHLLVDGVQVHPLPPALPDTTAALLGCGISTMLGAVFTIAEVRAGQSVAIVGLGHLGQWAAQAARLAGAGAVIGIDAHPARRELATASGATHLVDPARVDPVDEVRRLTAGRGADVVIEAAGPALAARQAVLMCRRAGTVVLSGVDHAATELTLPQLALTVHGKRILGCQNGQVDPVADFPRWIGMLERGELDPGPVVSGTYALGEIDVVMRRSMALEDVTGVFTEF
ncbi:alcohol dehydrogenase [Agromyces rhizosphaerae]|uniref:Alcohol dehydrogenase n=1 Tax=Agromyces rhizosphaerae TaxID=88374 RepID=A0A9W6CUY8_9MICO|nr:zinc-binding dehydrogenase [Agromyces rhizosphaerae]GLI26541.1 alcohol dehydrogenase [Agromyces rhizosphaerae]